MTKRSTPSKSTESTTTTKENDMTTTTTPAPEAEAEIVTHETIEAAVDAFLAGDTGALVRTIGALKGGARNVASGRAVQHMIATGADPERIGAVATAVQEAIEQNRSTPTAKPVLSGDEAAVATGAIQAWLKLGVEILPLGTWSALQQSAMVDTLERLAKKVSVTTGERATIRRDYSGLKGRKVTLKGTEHTGVMQADGSVKVTGRDEAESLSAAAVRLLGQKSVRGTLAWILTDGTPVGEAAAV